jgi:hypothetical protein
MAIRIKHKVNVRIAEDPGMEDLLFSPDDTRAEVIIDSFDRQASGNLNITASTNEDVPLGDVDAVKGFYLKLSTDCTIVLNGGTDQLSISKPASSSYAKVFIEMACTQINISVPAGDDLTGVYCVWGDPSA